MYHPISTDDTNICKHTETLWPIERACVLLRLLTFSSTIFDRILANPMCCLPMRWASILAWVSPMIKKQPHTSHISFFSWKFPGSISNPATVWGWTIKEGKIINYEGNGVIETLTTLALNIMADRSLSLSLSSSSTFSINSWASSTLPWLPSSSDYQTHNHN